MIAMKASKTVKPPPSTGISRSVKVADEIHYRVRQVAARKRLGVQELIEKLIVSSLKRYETGAAE
jgi:hypothetical protein